MSRYPGGHHCTARRTKVSLPLNSDIRESMIIALSCAADLPASRETLTASVPLPHPQKLCMQYFELGTFRLLFAHTWLAEHTAGKLCKKRLLENMHRCDGTTLIGLWVRHKVFDEGREEKDRANFSWLVHVMTKIVDAGTTSSGLVSRYQTPAKRTRLLCLQAASKLILGSSNDRKIRSTMQLLETVIQIASTGSSNNFLLLTTTTSRRVSSCQSPRC